MKSRKNLTRFTYDTTAFQGWRLQLNRRGTILNKYFSDKQYGGERKALKAASDALAEVKGLIDNSRLVNGKISKTTINKAKKLLASPCLVWEGLHCCCGGEGNTIVRLP